MSMAIKYQPILPDLPKVLFWDIPEQKPDYENHPEWVIKGVFERGNMGDIAEIMPFSPAILSTQKKSRMYLEKL